MRRWDKGSNRRHQAKWNSGQLWKVDQWIEWRCYLDYRKEEDCIDIWTCANVCICMGTYLFWLFNKNYLRQHSPHDLSHKNILFLLMLKSVWCRHFIRIRDEFYKYKIGNIIKKYKSTLNYHRLLFFTNTQLVWFSLDFMAYQPLLVI